ncbi:hypothetical protein [Phenylobacterium sp.]|uniref:hypothetical protein n=1 Tax=Phenylobacterium sp. TaxID=1871053 RepID=UPI002DF57726|nr:hypothetical protein [Phenylobacterium sp.]
MGTFEYLLLFAAVILGLAISDLAISLHRLLGAGRRVKWDWLAPLAALVAFLKIVTQWWTWHAAEALARGLTFEMFVVELVGIVLLFLLAAAALPDEAPRGEPVDLAAHYAAVSRRYWILFLAHWLVLNGVNSWVQMQIEGARFSWFAPAYLLAPLALALIFIPNRWVHTVVLAGLVVVYVGQFFGRALT